MANIIRRNERRQPNADLAPMFSPMWEPFQILRELASLRPFESLREVSPMMMERGFAPRFDVKETRDAYVFTADVPGVREDDLEISVTGNHLSINGRREEEERHDEDQYYSYERSFGTFTRNFSLPEGADPDRVTADFKNGVLRISVGKRPEVQPRKVSISGGGEKGKERTIQASESSKEKISSSSGSGGSPSSHGGSSSSSHGGSGSSGSGESSGAGSSGSMSEKPGDKNKPNR